MKRMMIRRLIAAGCMLLLPVSCISGFGHRVASAAQETETAVQETDTTVEATETAAQDSEEAVQSDEEIELVDPVGSAVGYVSAAYREIFSVSTYQGILCPKTREYTYDSAQSFGRYGALPGDEVHVGDMLFCAENQTLEDQIEEIREVNADLLVHYSDAAADYVTDREKALLEEYEAAVDNQEYIAAKPPEDSPFYAGWDAGGMWLEERYKQASLARRKLDQAQKERQELFELETDYNNKRIARLEAKKAAATVNADMDGVVVALQYAYAGDRVAEGSAMMAVGDPDQLVIRSEYISKSTVNKAVELYAIINGSRFEVQYENMEPEEYRRLKKLNDEVYSTFYVSDPEHRVQPGQSALLVAVESCRENALCIPKEAIHRDDSGNYVYLYENGESVYHQVQTGVSDGGFTEITGGLKEGDPVVYDASYHIGEKRVEAERGEVSVHFSTEGYLFYPTAEWLTNPAKNGTSYLKERCVERFEQISQGQVLARVEVIADRIGIERLQRKLDRQRERLADLQEKRSKTYAEEDQEIVDRAIRDRNRSIEELNHQMEKLARYSGVLEITSPCDGLVIDVNGLEEGSLISYQERLVQIADDRSCFIIVEDKNGQLSYGDTAQVSFKTNNGAALESQGQVVTMNRRGLSKEMITDYAMVRVPQEDFAAITGAGSESANGYWSRSRFSITADVRQMHDVVMVPKNATITIGGDTYAAVKTEDNSSYRLVRFVAGGSDNANYWVAYGDITEGMTLCY